jgi:hypothetical protein
VFPFLDSSLVYVVAFVRTLCTSSFVEDNFHFEDFNLDLVENVWQNVPLLARKYRFGRIRCVPFPKKSKTGVRFYVRRVLFSGMCKFRCASSVLFMCWYFYLVSTLVPVGTYQARRPLDRIGSYVAYVAKTENASGGTVPLPCGLDRDWVLLRNSWFVLRTVSTWHLFKTENASGGTVPLLLCGLIGLFFFVEFN